MKKFKTSLVAFTVTAFSTLITLSSPVHAQEEGSVIQIGTIDSLLWSIVKTIQFYSLPVGAVVIAGLGLKMLMSGDDANKDQLKNWMIRVGVGMAIIFGATTIASVLQSSVGG